MTIVSPTLVGNALFRAEVIRRLLVEDFDVQVVAFSTDADQVYPPLAGVDAYEQAGRFHATHIVRLRKLGVDLDRVIGGAVVICIKPLLHSYGAALLAGRRTRRPIVLDIDDWEPGFLSRSPYWEMRTWGHRWITATDSPLYTRLLDGFTYKAAAVTVSNCFLQGLYGGTWIPHARDPRPPDLESHPDAPPEVLFCGAVRGHKGLSTLVEAWRRVRHPGAVLHLAVPDPSNEILDRLDVRRLPRARVSGPHRFDDVPRLLARASVVAIPQDNAPGSVGQLPIKLLEAMEAGCAIVTTDVGDAARWLGRGGGLLVPAGAPGALADAIDYALEHPAEANAMGRRARERFLALGSTDVVRPRMVSLVRGLLDKAPMPAPEPAFVNDDRRG